MDAHANPGNVVLAVDLGSSRMRCVSVALGDMAASEVASAHYPVASARSGALARGFNAALLRTRLLSVLAKAAQDVGPRNVASIAITAQRGATCFFDSALRTLHAGPNADVRAVFEGAAFDEAFEPLVYGATGHMPSMMLVPAKLGWWRAHEPRTAQRIASVAGLDAWAALQLTGTLAETPHGQAEAGLLDVSTGEPARDLLSQLAVPLDLLPSTVPLGDAVGRLSREASEATGLPLDVMVHLAGPDAQAAGAGCGAVSPGDAGICAGWSAPVQITTASPRFDAEARTWVTLSAIAGRWIVEANPGDTGRTVDTMRRLLGTRLSYRRFDALAAAAAEDDGIVTAFLGPRALDMSNLGMTMGGLLMPAPVTQEGLPSGPVARAAYENVAFALRESLALARAVAGANPASVALTGGMSQSAVFPALLANVLGEPVRVHSHGTAIGAAILASTPDDERAERCAAMAASGTLVEPISRSLDYAGAYERWLRLRDSLDAMSGEL